MSPRASITSQSTTSQLHKSQYKIYQHAALGSFALLLLGGVAFLQPFPTVSDSYAETTVTSSSLDATVTIAPNITIWTTDTSDNNLTEADIAADPDETVATSAPLRVHVSTNNLTGYTLTAQSTSANAQMSHTGGATTTIDQLTDGGTSASDWQSDSDLNNMWGYSLGSTDSFKGVPGASATAATIATTTTPTTDSTTNVTFSAKADLSLSAGTYTDTVVFSAVANIVPHPITNGRYLQDITAADCGITPIYDPNNPAATTFTVKDSRDDQEYRVRRLYMTEDKINSPATTACWMVDNLRLTNDSLTAAGKSTTLTSNNTNLDADFTLVEQNTGAWCTSNNGTCINTVNHIGTSYGTLYNWYTATASTGAYSTYSGTATASLCPGKGAVANTWRLPTGGTGNEWHNLFSAYKADYGWTSVTGSSNSGPNNTLSTTIGLDLVYSGYRNGSNTASQSSSSGQGYWWSNTAGGYNSANDTTIFHSPSLISAGTGNHSKYRGHAVRCILPAA